MFIDKMVSPLIQQPWYDDGAGNVRLTNSSNTVVISGGITIGGNLAVTGDLTVSGDTTEVDVYITGEIIFGDSDTKIYENADDDLRTDIGGIELLKMHIPVAGDVQLLVDPGNTGTATYPSLALSDTGLGIYRSAANIMTFVESGTARFQLKTSLFEAVQSGGPALVGEDATAINPTLLPDKGDIDTGIGSAGTDLLSLIVNGVEIMRLASSQLRLRGSVLFEYSSNWLKFGEGYAGGIYCRNSLAFIMGNVGVTATRAALLAENASATNPNIVPNYEDSDTGLSWNAADQLSLTVGGVEGIRIVEDTYIAMHLPETTTPTAIANYCSIYPKADNNLYFQDGAGVEHVVELGASDFGEMGNIYGASASEILVSSGEWHGMYHANITGSAPHLNSGFTFVAGSNGSGAITTADGDNAININDVGHGLLTGDYVTVQSANHVGVKIVTKINDDNFTVVIAYIGNEAATWQMGSYLLVATTGFYRGLWNGSFSQSLNNTQTSIITPFVNAIQATKAPAKKLLSNNTDEGSIGGNGLMNFTIGDRLWFACQTTAAQTLTFTIRNMTIH